ncbi:MAG: hypothetical protein H7X94_00855 [Vallitaleaceae bacterium]|nr:hypothetical protein [Vallitaleaceae bacterium]
MIKYKNSYPMYQSINTYENQPKHVDLNNHMLLPKRIQMPQNQENEDEAGYMKSMYSATCKRIQVYVDEACDKMDYEGSMMFDEYPDKESVDYIANNILETVQKDDLIYPCEVDLQAEAIENMQLSPRNEWLGEIVKIMLLNEIFGRRRLRHYNRYGHMNNYYEPFQTSYATYPNQQVYGNYGYDSDYYRYYFD